MLAPTITIACYELHGDPASDLAKRRRNAPWCHFRGIGEFVITNADYPDRDALANAMADHIGYRNRPHRDQRLIKPSGAR